jgi:hypothetical membrane protein
VRVLALGGIAGPAVFVLTLVVCGALRPDYSHVSQFISELGASGTRHAGLMNFAGFVPGGLLVAVFGLSLTSALPRRGVSLLAATCISLFGLGLAVAGIVHCAPGCPQDEMTLHDGVSIAAFLAGITGAALFAGLFRSARGWRALWLYSALTSAAALGFLVALASSIELRVLTGLWQRLLVGTLLLWCAVVGLHAFRSWIPTQAVGASE